MPGDARSGRALNSLHQGAEQSWLFLRLKLVVVGQLSRWLSSAFSPGPRAGARPRVMRKTCGTGLAVEVAVALGVRGGSLLELRSSAGAEGPTPLSHEVEGGLPGCWACVVTQTERGCGAGECNFDFLLQDE